MTTTISTPSDDRQAVVDTIMGEHRSLGHVLELVGHLLGSISAQRSAADFELLSAALKHMRKEEKLLVSVGDDVPAAEWRSIAEAFASEDDPLFGKTRRREFDRLRDRIAYRLPSKLRFPFEHSARP